MSNTSVDVSLWYDAGYDEGSVVVPSLDSSISSVPNFKFTDLHPATGTMFSQFTIVADYEKLMWCRYLKAVYHLSNANTSTGSGIDVTVYGWIDSVTLRSDGRNGVTDPTTIISWHIDLWRTYASTGRYGYGLVQRRPRRKNPQDKSAGDPPQSCSYRYRKPGEFQSLEFADYTDKDGTAHSVYGKESNWVIIHRVVEGSNNKITSIERMVIPISKTSTQEDKYIVLESIDGTVQTTYKCPRLTDFVSGKFDEDLGLTSTTVSSVYVAPIPPISVKSGTGTAADPYVIQCQASAVTSTTEVTAVNSASTDYVLASSSGGWNDNGNYYTWKFTYSSGDTDSFIQADFDDWADDYNGYKLDGSSTRVWGPAYPSYVTLEGYKIRPRIDGTEYEYLYCLPLEDWVEYVTAGLSMSVGDYIRVDPDTVQVAYYTRSHSNSGLTDYIDVTSPGEFYTVYDEIALTSGGWKARIVGGSGSGSVVPLTDLYVLTTDPGATYTLYQQHSSVTYEVDVRSNTTSEGAVYGYAVSNSDAYPEYTQRLASDLVTTDTKEWIFTDYNGTPVASMPWGIPIRDYTVRCVLSSSACYMEFRFTYGLDSHCTGTDVTVPLPAIDLTSNSWSDYVYSGARDAEIRQREISANQALVSGLTSTFTGGISNGILGGLNNNVTNDTTTTYKFGDQTASEHTVATTTSKMGGAKAGLLSLAGGVAASLVDYAATKYFNGQLQKAEDMLQAKQLDSIAMAGSGWDWLWNGRPCGLVSLVPDDYSIDRFTLDVARNGIWCSEPTDDCDGLVREGGPLRISDLQVTGHIPVEAVSYIRGRFSNGVRLVSNINYLADIPLYRTDSQTCGIYADGVDFTSTVWSNLYFGENNEVVLTRLTGATGYALYRVMYPRGTDLLTKGWTRQAETSAGYVRVTVI